jgi:CheY-like chemotaxis protein
MIISVMKRILLVDDDIIFHMLNTKALNRIGFSNSNIQTAMNGKQALEIFNVPENPGQFPDIILLDLNMPIMNGFEFMEAFQKLDLEKKQSVKIVVVTSSGNPNDIKRALNLGASEFLIKPLKDTELQTILEFA